MTYYDDDDKLSDKIDELYEVMKELRKEAVLLMESTAYDADMLFYDDCTQNLKELRDELQTQEYWVDN